MKIAFDERVKENADFLFQPKDQWQYQETFNYDLWFRRSRPLFCCQPERNPPRMEKETLIK
jgi:hypothetical protein